MARGGYVKQEPKGYGSSSVSSPAARAASKSQAVSKTPAPTATTDEPSEWRAARSNAPSVDTRLVASGVEVRTQNDEGEDVVLMEVRPRIKSLPEEEEEGLRAHASLNHSGSFISNHQAFQAIGQKLREVNDTLGTLQSLGIQHVAQLPELVLVGDQSAGKSSIMSAIAGLNLPHNTGVCTRCPIHIRSSRSVSTEWSCRITLQQDYAFVPGRAPIAQDDVSPENPFPPWVKQPRVVKDFATIRDRVDSVERVLRWAQVAILNHNANHEMFIPRGTGGHDGDDDEEALARAEERTEAKFSPNTVALEIKGPDLPDLSFYDLPGVFMNAPQDEDQYLAQVVENLTREYISHPGAIILWAVPMNTDAMVSSTFKIIRQMRAEARCLGVMTKADLLPRGNHAQWISMLEGVDHRTGLGYFVTSRPDTGDLDKQAAWEESFFNQRARLASHAETPVWPAAFADFEDRCGVVRLKDFLSRKLAEEFAKSLPLIKNIIQQQLKSVVDELQKLPDLPPNPELEIRKGLLAFANRVQSRILSQEFSSEWAKKAEEFMDAILGMKPKIVVKPEPAVIDVDADGAAATGAHTPPHPPPKRRAAGDHYNNVQATPSKRRVHEPPVMSGANGGGGGGGGGGRAVLVKSEAGAAPTSPFPILPRGARPPAGPPGSPSVRGEGGVKRSRTLPEIREILVSKRRPGVPDAMIPQDVYEYLCMEAVRPWHVPLTTFTNETMRLVQKEVVSALDGAFANLKKRQAYRESKRHLLEFVRGHREVLTRQLTRAYEAESYRMFTFNNALFERNLEDERRTLARFRHHYRWEAHSGQGSAPPKPLERLTEDERAQEQERMRREALKLGRDPYEQELDVVAHVRGYYLTAAYRFIDNVSLHVTSGLFPAISESVPLYLDEKLGLVGGGSGPNGSGSGGGAGPALFDRLMEEEPKTADRRRQLRDDKRKFDEAMECILALERSARHANGDDDQRTATEGYDDEDDLGASHATASEIREVYRMPSLMEEEVC